MVMVVTMGHATTVVLLLLPPPLPLPLPPPLCRKEKTVDLDRPWAGRGVEAVVEVKEEGKPRNLRCLLS